MAVDFTSAIFFGNWEPFQFGLASIPTSFSKISFGLSMRVTVDVHDTSGHMLAQAPTLDPLYTTPIYSQQFEEMVSIDPLIVDVITQNTYIP